MAQTLAVFKPQSAGRAGQAKLGYWCAGFEGLGGVGVRGYRFHLSPKATCVTVQGFPYVTCQVSLFSHEHQESGTRNEMLEDKESK